MESSRHGERWWSSGIEEGQRSLGCGLEPLAFRSGTLSDEAPRGQLCEWQGAINTVFVLVVFFIEKGDIKRTASIGLGYGQTCRGIFLITVWGGRAQVTCGLC